MNRQMILAALAASMIILTLPGGAFAENSAIVKDTEARFDSGHLSVILVADNLAGKPLQAIAEVVLSGSNGAKSLNSNEEYILLPSITNRITVNYDGIISPGNYTLQSKLKYASGDSNTLIKNMLVHENMSVSLSDFYGEPSNSTMYAVYSMHGTAAVILLVAIFLAALAVREFPKRYPGTTLKILSFLKRIGELLRSRGPLHEHGTGYDAIDNILNADGPTMLEGAPGSSEFRTKIGIDVIDALKEEATRIRQEIASLESLVKKGFLKKDAFEQRKEILAFKLSKISRILGADKSALTAKEIKSMAANLSKREIDLFKSEKILDSLFKEKVIGEDLYNKNKKEIHERLDKLRKMGN